MGVAAGVPRPQPGRRAARCCELDGGPVLCGAYAISEYLAEGAPASPEADEAEPFAAVSRRPRGARRDAPPGRLVPRQVQSRGDARAAAREGLRRACSRRQRQRPTSDFLRAIRANLRYHLSYISYLARPPPLAGRRRAVASPISPPPRICHRSTIWAKCHGRSLPSPRSGTRASSRGARSARFWPTACPGAPPSVALRQPRFLTAASLDDGRASRTAQVAARGRARSASTPCA